jgi:hypothetical protein
MVLKLIQLNLSVVEFQHHNVGLSSKKKTMALNHQTDGFKR